MFFESLKMALSSLISNKMRALLTMLGIIVGIASVIAIVSLGEGGKTEILGQFEQIGASSFFVQVRSSEARSSDYLTEKDLEAIETRIDSVRMATTSIQTVARAETDMSQSRIFLTAIDKDYSFFSPIEIVHGRTFSEIEYQDDRPVVILDRTGAQKLFGRENAVGEQIVIEHDNHLMRATVIGISESATSQFSGIADRFGSEDSEFGMPNFVYLPLPTASRLMIDNQQIDTALVMAKTPEQVDEAAAAVVRLLEMRHGNADRSIYSTQNFASILDQINTVINVLTIFISAVAAISLLVGGIGVMNIMLVSVTERTREIGIRKAVGAATSDIMLQFMTESIILTLFGGLLGILAGLGLASGIAWFVETMDIASITPVLSVQSIIIAVLFSSTVGLFFGIYPARKAARMNPIDALRYE